MPAKSHALYWNFGWTGANGKRKVAGGNFIEKSEWKRAQAKKYECLRNATPAA